MSDVKCPRCGDTMLKFLENSTLCEYCYQAAIHGGTAEQWKKAKADYIERCRVWQLEWDKASSDEERQKLLDQRL